MITFSPTRSLTNTLHRSLFSCSHMLSLTLACAITTSTLTSLHARILTQTDRLTHSYTHTIKQSRGHTLAQGDIRSSANIEALAAAGPRVQLVTADGSFDCSTCPGEQEAVVAHLHYCEAVAAMRLLERDGHFVLKMFTYFERSSLDLL
jgi:23S rRNA U2552 (ribose-2'-O)-methylase RlmE/FtsJ